MQPFRINIFYLKYGHIGKRDAAQENFNGTFDKSSHTNGVVSGGIFSYLFLVLCQIIIK